MGHRFDPDELHPMTPRKRLEGALADWHPHPKSSNNSLVPVVRDAAPADEIADRFFDSTPNGYTPEPMLAVDAAETTPRRAALNSAAARERRRYLSRYVAGAVGLAAVIGVVAMVRVTTTRDASAAQLVARERLFNAASAASQAIAEPLPLPAAEPVSPPLPATPEPAPSEPAIAAAIEGVVPPAAAEAEKPEPASDSTPPAVTATDVSQDTASHAKQEAQRALDRGHLKKAIEAGERSVSLDPGDADAWLILGAAYQAHGAFTAARRCFTDCSHLAKRGARRECRALLR
jgi:Flp pilus assembly protein TadD